MRDAVIEGGENDLPAFLVIVAGAEVVPETKGEGRKLETAIAAAAVLHVVVSSIGRRVWHMCAKVGREFVVLQNVCWWIVLENKKNYMQTGSWLSGDFEDAKLIVCIIYLRVGCQSSQIVYYDRQRQTITR